MLRELCDILKSVIPIMFVVMLLFFIMFTPIAYIGGKVKSNYIRQMKGIEMPWYQACWLKVHINSVDFGER